MDMGKYCKMDDNFQVAYFLLHILAGVSVQPPHGITTAPLGIKKKCGLTTTPGDKALCWVSNVHQHLQVLV